MSELAVKDCTVEIISGQTPTKVDILTPPSEDVIVNSKGVYFGDITVQLTSVSAVAQGYVCALDTITISGTARDIIEVSTGDKAVQKGDTGTKKLTFTNSQGASVLEDVTIKVTNAGQTDVSQLDD